MLTAALEKGVLLEKEVSYIKNIGAYNEKKNKGKYSFLKNNSYNSILEEAWKDWLEDLTCLRNIISHKIPLGGRTWAYGQIPIDGAMYNVLFLPKFSDIKKSNIDFVNILKIEFEESSGFSEMLKRNSKAYSDEIHKKVHKLMEELLMVKSS